MASQPFEDSGFHEPSPFVPLRCTNVRGMGRSYGVSSFDVVFEWLFRQAKKIRINGWQFIVMAAVVAGVGSAMPLPSMPAFPIAMGVLGLAAFCKRSVFAGLATLAMASLSWLYMIDTAQRLSSYR